MSWLVQAMSLRYTTPGITVVAGLVRELVPSVKRKDLTGEVVPFFLTFRTMLPVKEGRLDPLKVFQRLPFFTENSMLEVIPDTVLFASLPVTGTSTFTAAVFETPFGAVAVTVVFPTATPVTLPAALTVAIAVFALDQLSTGKPEFVGRISNWALIVDPRSTDTG